MMRWSANAVEDTALTAESKAFLIEVGMPSPRGGHLSPGFFHWLQWDASLPQSADHNGRRILADLVTSPLFLDEVTGRVITGAFVAQHTRRRHPERFVNSSVRQFAAALTEAEKLWRLNIDFDEPGLLAVSHFENRLREIDEACLVGDQNLWVVDLEILRSPA